MAIRKALGKGLAALIPDQGKMSMRVIDVPIEEIVTNRYQPREDFKDEPLKELADSIKEKGVIQPILVHKLESGYELIAGERRYRASKLLGLKTVPAIIKSIQKSEALELAIIENIQREDLNPMEEAKAYKHLIDEFHFTQDSVAKKVGRSRSAITNGLRLLKLPDPIQKDISSGRITAGHARALLACDSPTQMLEMRRQILSFGLNVREVEKKTRKKIAATKKAPASDVFIREITDRLRKLLSTKITVTQNRKGGGKITIEYYSNEELDRIIELIG